MAWRPEDWDNPYKEATVSDFGLGRQEVYGWEHKVFEAGADAMLFALKRWGEAKTRQCIRGYSVFIPDEEVVHAHH